jgi:hypothetical protein
MPSRPFGGIPPSGLVDRAGGVPYNMASALLTPHEPGATTDVEGASTCES